MFANGDIDREAANGGHTISIPILIHDNPADRKQQRKNQTTVQVTILDRNDNAPKFKDKSYVKEILESLLPGASVITLSASDPDRGDNGTVKYSFGPSSNASDLFIIDQNTGIIYLNDSITDNIGIFHLEVIASDQGSPPLNSTTDVYINVRDENNNAPVFQNHGTTFSIYEVSYFSDRSQVLH